MPKYRVTMRVSSVETIEADNPYQAAALISARHGGDVEIADVRPAVGRVATKTTKKVAKKRRRLSPEARARLAQNLVKARAARAAKRKGAKKVTKKAVKKTAKKRTAKKATKKR